MEAQQNDRKRCEHALTLLQELYAIERKAKQEILTAEAVLALRQEKSVPVRRELREWMIAEYPKVLPSSAIGTAITYSLRR
ncbi:MAG: transposase [Ginsengibacter sp.]